MSTEENEQGNGGEAASPDREMVDVEKTEHVTTTTEGEPARESSE